MPKSKWNLNAIYISERLQESLRPISRCTMTAIVAPMGYGKTTAVNWYLAERAKTEALNVIRISVYADNLTIFWKSVQDAFAHAEEKLWVAVWGEGAVYRGDPETGKWERAVEVPCASHSSSCTFAGQELDVLVITTGQVEGEEGSGYTYAAQVGTRGRAPYVYGGEEKGNEE